MAKTNDIFYMQRYDGTTDYAYMYDSLTDMHPSYPHLTLQKNGQTRYIGLAPSGYGNYNTIGRFYNANDGQTYIIYKYGRNPINFRKAVTRWTSGFYAGDNDFLIRSRYDYGSIYCDYPTKVRVSLHMCFKMNEPRGGTLQNYLGISGATNAQISCGAVSSNYVLYRFQVSKIITLNAGTNYIYSDGYKQEYQENVGLYGVYSITSEIGDESIQYSIHANNFCVTPEFDGDSNWAMVCKHYFDANYLYGFKYDF
jgi:hypothetical protein